MFRKALLLLSGNATAALLTLARNLLLARLIPVEDYGIAATFAVTMAIVEMASALGLQQQIVQAKDGDEPRFQAALQGFQLLRGVLAGLALLALARPIASFLGIPEIAWAYQVLAVMPVLNALAHFDIHRLQRRAIYRPSILTATIPAALSFAAIWPLVLLFGDWRAMLAAIVLQGLGAVVVSHWLAERRYALAFDPAVMRRALRFGLPILGDAVLLFFLFNGEKLIVGRELGMATLGIFAMGVTLTLTPILVAGRTLNNLFLPRLSLARTEAGADARYQSLASTACEITMIFALFMGLGAMWLGEPFVHLVLGEKYAPLVPILVLLAVQQGFFFLKYGPAVVALSAGQTENGLAASIPRVLLLPVAWWVTIQTGRLDLLIAVAIAGEIAGLAVAAWLMRRRVGVRLRPIGLQIVLTFSALGAIAIWHDAGLWAQAAIVALCLAALAAMTFTRGTLLRRA